MDMVAGAVRFIVVAIAAEVEEIEFVNEALLLEEIDGAVDGDEMDGGIDLLGAAEDLVHVEMALGVVHDLEKNAALASEADAALTQRLLEVAGGFGGVETLSARDPACGNGGHRVIVQHGGA